MVDGAALRVAVNIAANKNGISIEEVGRILGVTRQTVYNLFEKHEISEKHLYLLRETRIPAFVELWDERVRQTNARLENPNLTHAAENIILRQLLAEKEKVIKLLEENMKLLKNQITI